MENKNIQIAEAGLAMFLKFGIRRTTMNDIAQAAGVTRQTLYNSFENKDAVLKHAVSFYCDRQLQQVRDECETATELEQKLHRLRKWMEEQKLPNTFRRTAMGYFRRHWQVPLWCYSRAP